MKFTNYHYLCLKGNPCYESGCKRDKGHPLFDQGFDEPSCRRDRRGRRNDTVEGGERLSGRIAG